MTSSPPLSTTPITDDGQLTQRWADLLLDPGPAQSPTLWLGWVRPDGTMLPLLVPDRDTVVIGGKGFSEQYVLQRLIGRRLEAAGYAVAYRDGLGSAVVFGALDRGDIDITVDYAGTLWTNEMRRADTVPRAQMIASIARWAEQSGDARVVGGLGFDRANGGKGTDRAFSVERRWNVER